MDSKNHALAASKIRVRPIGWVYLALFVSLILAGIIVKRVYGHPEFMSLFHLPAAVFLVLSGYELTRRARAKYQASLRKAG